MNNNHSDTQLMTPLEYVKKLVRTNLVGTITVTVAGSLLLTGVTTWNIWSIYNSFQTVVIKQIDLQKISANMVYLDEALTMSARMLVSTGDLQWETRYNQFVPKADVTMKKFAQNVTPELLAEQKRTDTASAKLFELEDTAFKLIRKGKQKEAFQVLMGNEYAIQKKIFGDGNDVVIDKVKKSIQAELKNYEQQLLLSIVFAGVTLPILLVSWTLVLAAVREYIRDRVAAQIAIEQSQANLIAVNEALAAESKIRQEQETIVREERDILQQDIGELLDVVCEIETGNFTVNAKVNDRATGLIADVLNRLVEGLGLVFSQVSIEANRVAANSNLQDKIATTVTQNTSEQTKSVEQVLALTETVRQSANNAAIQLIDTDRSLGSLQVAVNDGEQTIRSLDREIDVLQEGSDSIVQQMKALGEFVGLSDRFVDDQTDIATQTQILALNAALVAARAAEQRDPKLFESVAREFESIARQVSQLAQQTNEGLNSLEQRNTQIHRVVSDVDTEVQRLGGLVNSFTQGVKQTREVFATVQSVTGQVVKAGEIVSQTSQTIIEAADSTARSISSIATLSAQIDAQSQTARSISSQMNDLSAGLLSNIEIFKLPSHNLTIVDAAAIATPDTELSLEEPQYQLN